MHAHDPGVAYTPVAIVLDHYNGYNAYQGRPWGILENTPGDLETYDLFEEQLFAGSDHIHRPANPVNPEKSFLRPTPYGEMFDVLLSNACTEVLSTYPVILLVGDHEFDAQFVCNLFDALRAGSKLLLKQEHAEQLGEDFKRLQGTGDVEVLESWENPDTRRPAAISNTRLTQLRDTLLPFRVEGDPVQYQVNRTASGWIVEIINNEGVIKKPTEPAVVQKDKLAHIVITPQVSVSSATLLRSGDKLEFSPTISLSIPSGETRFVVVQ